MRLSRQCRISAERFARVPRPLDRGNGVGEFGCLFPGLQAVRAPRTKLDAGRKVKGRPVDLMQSEWTIRAQSICLSRA